MIFKVWGDKDADGFYWGEARGRAGFVPHNMVAEVEEGSMAALGAAGVGSSGVVQSTTTGPGPMQGGTGTNVRGVPRDRWGDIYANLPVKRMVAMYDYDPQELSPNVDADVSVRL